MVDDLAKGLTAYKLITYNHLYIYKTKHIV